jgi:Spy/CpxP family protein refolding chaperone
MKRILTVALALVLFAGAAQAQTKDTARQHHRGGHEMMMKQLNLTADQQARFKSLREEQRQEAETIRNDKSLSASQQKEKMKGLHQKYRDQMQTFLTSDQKAQMEKMRAEWKSKEKSGKGFKNGNRGEKNMEGFKKQLNLTSDQEASLTKIRTESRSQFETVRNDKSLTQEQKKAKMKELRTQQQEQMKSILTREQMEKMESFRKEHKKDRV